MGLKRIIRIFIFQQFFFQKGKLIKRYFFQFILHFLNAGFYLSPDAFIFFLSPFQPSLRFLQLILFLLLLSLFYTLFLCLFPQFSR